MSYADNERAYIESVVQHGAYSNRYRLSNHVKYVFGDVRGVGKALDIGGGIGILSFYLASQGVSRIVCIEPEADGSTQGVNSVFDDLKADLPFGGNVHLEKTTFQDYDPGDSKFDLIVAHNSVNHLNEPACVDLKDNRESYETYLSYFGAIYDMLEDGGRFIAIDCSRYCLYASLGVTNPFMPDIEWEKHQSPYMWRKMLLETGFVSPSIEWTAFNSLGGLGRLVMNNPLVSYLTVGHFRLSVSKP